MSKRILFINLSILNTKNYILKVKRESQKKLFTGGVIIVYMRWTLFRFYPQQPSSSCSYSSIAHNKANKTALNALSQFENYRSFEAAAVSVKQNSVSCLNKNDEEIWCSNWISLIDIKLSFCIIFEKLINF